MDNINFLGKEDFPVDTETLDMMQGMIKLCASLSLMGAPIGEKYILTGCVENNGIVGDGIVVIGGQPHSFSGGAKKDKVSIIEDKQTLTAFGEEYPDAIIKRTVSFAENGAYNWADFTRIPTLSGLQALIQSIRGDAPGMIKMWAGQITKIPADYKLCNGDEFVVADYPELFDALGFGYATGPDTFKIPDLRGRFIVGFDNSKTDYNAIGKNGGEEKHALTIEENAEHQHIVPWGENLSTAWQPEWGYDKDYFNNSRGYSANVDNDNTWPYSSYSGKGAPHENRPPYYVLAYIIKVKP